MSSIEEASAERAGLIVSTKKMFNVHKIRHFKQVQNIFSKLAS
jgi:hypothetical protein